MSKVQAVVDAFKKVWTDVRDWFATLWSGIRLPDFSTWSNRPSSLTNEPVGAALRRRLTGAPEGTVGPGAGDFVRAPGAPRERVDLYLHVPQGVAVDPRAPEAWSIHRQQDLIDAYRPGRGAVDPASRP